MRTRLPLPLLSVLILSAVRAAVARPEPDAAPARGTAPETVRLGAHVLPARSRAVPVPPAGPRAGESREPGDELLTLTIVLRRDDEEGFQRLLARLADPRSPESSTRLTPVEVSGRFGPSRDAYDTVLSHLESRGFSVVEGSANRLTLV